MKNIIYLLPFVLLTSCVKETTEPVSLEAYIIQNQSLERGDIIACAAGKPDGLDGSGVYPTSVFFYPIDGAYDFKYFEANNISDSLDFTKYKLKTLSDDPVFNGYLWKFNNTEFSEERMAVVTYKTPGKLHTCTPIRMKTNVKATEQNANLVTVTENGTTPTFTWTDGIIDENVIYFQVISDTLGNLISGTYTYDTTFTFYNLSNVVLNIRDVSPAPSLQPNNIYNFTLMAVSEDNWVNLVAELPFNTF